MQTKIEKMYSKKQLLSLVRQDLETLDNWIDILIKAEMIFEEYLNGSYYDSKNKRIANLRDNRPKDLIEILLTSCVAYGNNTLVAMCAICANILEKDDNRDEYLTIAELLAIFKDLGIYRLERVISCDSYMVVPMVMLEDDVIDAINTFHYLPPMVCRPNFIRKNTDSPWLTVPSHSMAGHRLGRHDGNISLDIINIQNQKGYMLDKWFISNFEDDHKANIAHAIDYDSHRARFEEAQRNHLKQLDAIYELLTDVFYIPTQVDTRGRVYTSGYHINPQSYEYKKAMLNLSEYCQITIN